MDGSTRHLGCTNAARNNLGFDFVWFGVRLAQTRDLLLRYFATTRQLNLMILMLALKIR